MWLPLMGSFSVRVSSIFTVNVSPSGYFRAVTTNYFSRKLAQLFWPLRYKGFYNLVSRRYGTYIPILYALNFQAY